LIREANLQVVINENGRQVRLSKHDVAIRQLIHKAMKGEMHASRTFFGYYRQASERLAVTAASQKAEKERCKDVLQLTDAELMKIIQDSMEEEGRKQKSRR
jgi:hypothetical protein